MTSQLSDLITNVVGGKRRPRSPVHEGEVSKKTCQKYKVLSGPSAGAGWANEFLGKGYRAGDFSLSL